MRVIDVCRSTDWGVWVSPKRGRGEGEGVVFSSLNSEVKKVECNAGP